MSTDEITADELKRSFKKVVLIDVRELWEYVLGSLEGAVHKPLKSLMQDIDAGTFTLPKEREIVVYCASGVRSKVATDFLRNKGFAARNLIGGYRAWKEKN